MTTQLSAIEKARDRAIPYVNAVVASLAVLTGGELRGVIRADRPFRPNLSASQLGVVMLAAVEQDEVSLSIYASDPLLAEAIATLSDEVGRTVSADRVDDEVIRLDEQIQRAVRLLDGRGNRIREIVRHLTERGRLSVKEAATMLREDGRREVHRGTLPLQFATFA